MKAVAILDIGDNNSVDTDVVLKNLKSIVPLFESELHKLSDFHFPISRRNILLNQSVMQYHWEEKHEFSTPTGEVVIFHNPIGFTVDLTSHLAVIRMPCIWRVFVVNEAWSEALKKCIKAIAKVFLAKDILYISEDLCESSGCFNAIYEKHTNNYSFSDVINCITSNKQYAENINRLDKKWWVESVSF